MAEFKKMEGLVYKTFDRNIHVVTPDKVPHVGTHIVGIDFGFTNPTAVLYILIDYDQNWWVYDEIYERGKTINEIAEIIKEKAAGKHILTYIGDSAQAEHIANLNQQNIPTVPISKRKDSITAGINLIQEKLKPREQLVGKPKPKLFIASNCINLIEEFEKYRYPKTANSNKNEKEEPMKKDDHGLDALRYAALYYKFDINQTYDFPAEELFTGGFYR
jgi:phage terminase large subunit